MALDYKVCIKPCCKTNLVIIADCTGEYNEFINPGGFGAPNIEPSDIDSFTVSIIFPNLSEPFVATLSPVIYDPYTPQIIPMSEFGLPDDTQLVDGYASLTAQIVGTDSNGDPFNYVSKKETVFTCQVECCVAKLDAEHKVCGCGCQDDKVMDAYTHYLGIKRSEKCGNINRALENLSELQKICDGKCSKC